MQLNYTAPKSYRCITKSVARSCIPDGTSAGASVWPMEWDHSACFACFNSLEYAWVHELVIS